MTPAKHALLCATERLYVESGPSVSLREIAQAAGQRNNSAVNYHFGSREGIESAVLRYRTVAMEQVRAALLAGLEPQGDRASLTDLVRVLVDPMTTVPYEQGSTHYARFIELVRSFPSMQHEIADPDLWSVSRRTSARIVRRLHHLDRAVAWRRMAAMTTTMFALGADRERAMMEGGDVMDAEELADLLVGLVRG